MKKIFLIVVVVFISTITKSQTVNDIPLKDINVEYVQIVGTSKMFTTKVTIKIDFGQETTFFGKYNETVLKDDQGNLVEFNSMIDALNFMSQNGYNFVTAYALTMGQTNVYHFLLQKKSLSKQNEDSVN